MAAVARVPVVGEMDGFMAEWIVNNSARIYQAKLLKGGWEVWAQVELSFFLSTRFFHYEFGRELNVFDDARKIDVWMQHLQINNLPNIGVELKCRTALETASTFRLRLIVDMNRIKLGPAQSKKPSRMYAFGITMDPADLNGYQSVINPATNSQVFFHQVVTDQHLGNIYIVWWQHDFA